MNESKKNSKRSARKFEFSSVNIEAAKKVFQIIQRPTSAVMALLYFAQQNNNWIQMCRNISLNI